MHHQHYSEDLTHPTAHHLDVTHGDLDISHRAQPCLQTLHVSEGATAACIHVNYDNNEEVIGIENVPVGKTVNDQTVTTAPIIKFKVEPGFTPPSANIRHTMRSDMLCPFPERIDYLDGSRYTSRKTSFSSHALVKDGQIGPGIGNEHLFGHVLDQSDGADNLYCNDNCKELQKGVFFLACDLLLSSSDSDYGDIILVDYGNGPDSIGKAEHPIIIHSSDENKKVQTEQVKKAKKKAKKRAKRQKKNINHCQLIKKTRKKKTPTVPNRKRVKWDVSTALPLAQTQNAESGQSTLAPIESTTSGAEVENAVPLPLPSVEPVANTSPAQNAESWHTPLALPSSTGTAAAIQNQNAVPTANPSIETNAFPGTVADIFQEIEIIVGHRSLWPSAMYSLFLARRLSYKNIFLVSLFGYINNIPEYLFMQYLEAKGVQERVRHNATRLYASFRAVPANFSNYYSYHVKTRKNMYLNAMLM